MVDQPHLIEVVEVADVEGHAAVAEIADDLVHDHVVGLAVVIEIVDVPTAVAAVVLALIVKVLVGNLVLAASLKSDKKTVVQNQDKILE